VAVSVEDTLIPIQEFSKDIATHLLSLAGSACKVEVVQLSWQGTPCKPEDELDSYTAVAPDACFTAAVLVIPKEENVLPLELKVTRHGAEPFPVTIPSKYATVCQLKQLVKKELPGTSLIGTSR
jgi:hypothetical protein